MHKGEGKEMKVIDSQHQSSLGCPITSLVLAMPYKNQATCLHGGMHPPRESDRQGNCWPLEEGSSYLDDECEKTQAKSNELPKLRLQTFETKLQFRQQDIVPQEGDSSRSKELSRRCLYRGLCWHRYNNIENSIGWSVAIQIMFIRHY